MKLQLSTWTDIEARLKSDDRILFPIGSTEQHGPTGLIGTDAICPETIASGLSEHGVLIGPTLSIGMAQHHLAFPGSITLRPSTLIALVRDVVESLASQGFRKFLFLNGHGGNINTVQAAFAEIYAQASLSGSASGLQLELFNWFQGQRVTKLTRELFADDEGWHATPSEISLTWYAYPNQVRDTPLEPRRAPLGKIRDALDYRATFPDGRIGSDPSRASVEYGKQICAAALVDAMERWNAMGERRPAHQ